MQVGDIVGWLKNSDLTGIKKSYTPAINLYTVKSKTELGLEDENISLTLYAGLNIENPGTGTFPEMSTTRKAIYKFKKKQNLLSDGNEADGQNFTPYDTFKTKLNEISPVKNHS